MEPDDPIILSTAAIFQALLAALGAALPLAEQLQAAYRRAGEEGVDMDGLDGIVAALRYASENTQEIADRRAEF